MTDFRLFQQIYSRINYLVKFDVGTTYPILGKPKLITLFDGLCNQAPWPVGCTDDAWVGQNSKYRLISWSVPYIQFLSVIFSAKLIFVSFSMYHCLGNKMVNTRCCGLPFLFAMRIHSWGSLFGDYFSIKPAVTLFLVFISKNGGENVFNCQKALLYITSHFGNFFSTQFLSANPGARHRI